MPLPSVPIWSRRGRGAAADFARRGLWQAASFLGVDHVVLRGESALEAPMRALRQNAVHLAVVEAITTAFAQAAGAVVVERGGEVVEVRLDLVGVQVGGEQTHAAVDVVADAARRDHAVGQAGRDAADGKAVALMHVGHGDGVADNAGQRGGVDQLLDALIGQRFFQQRLAGVDAGGHAHVGAVRLGDFPDVGADAFQVFEGDHGCLLPGQTNRGAMVVRWAVVWPRARCRKRPRRSSGQRGVRCEAGDRSPL